ncbi:hypothetical protein B0H16DRAFT_1729057 [Mycena metata]|uniref:Uncharacterized protein n=1 Tax=Mycena metata TaxID=1033252 RepID=A0AAD7ID24_9AGAR|nr:hypothetical protein B0H16DRAFT_1729057 [Mycena metata]
MQGLSGGAPAAAVTHEEDDHSPPLDVPRLTQIVWGGRGRAAGRCGKASSKCACSTAQAPQRRRRARRTSTHPPSTSLVQLGSYGVGAGGRSGKARECGAMKMRMQRRPAAPAAPAHGEDVHLPPLDVIVVLGSHGVAAAGRREGREKAGHQNAHAAPPSPPTAAARDEDDHPPPPDVLPPARITWGRRGRAAGRGAKRRPAAAARDSDDHPPPPNVPLPGRIVWGGRGGAAGRGGAGQRAIKMRMQRRPACQRRRRAIATTTHLLSTCPFQVGSRGVAAVGRREGAGRDGAPSKCALSAAQPTNGGGAHRKRH